MFSNSSSILLNHRHACLTRLIDFFEILQCCEKETGLFTFSFFSFPCFSHKLRSLFDPCFSRSQVFDCQFQRASTFFVSMSSSPIINRSLDIVVWAATGYTGSLVSHYLANQMQKRELRLGLAGRNASKLEKLKNELVAANPHCQSIQLLPADLHEDREMDRLVEFEVQSLSRILFPSFHETLHLVLLLLLWCSICCCRVVGAARVVISCVGVFNRHGEPVVQACVRQRTDYCDITGEVAFVRRLIDLYHDEAQRNNIFLVPMCGVSSVPSDLGTLLVVNHVKQTMPGERLQSVHATFQQSPTFGSFSGGTISTMLSIYGASSADKAIIKAPYALNPSSSTAQLPLQCPRSREDRDRMLPRYLSSLHCWTAPSPMVCANCSSFLPAAFFQPRFELFVCFFLSCRRSPTRVCFGALPNYLTTLQASSIKKA